MDFKILGPLEVRGESGVVPLGGPKPRAVLAMLLLHPNEPVSAERLAMALFGEETAAGSAKKVQVHVSRLRKALGEDILTTTPAGYRLRVDPGELDAERFDRLVQQGRSALSAGQCQEAAALLREAEDMWRGPPLADLADEPFAPAEIARLEEQQLAAIEARAEADAAAGRHADLIPELRRLVAEHPTRERLAAQLMLALYRCGRQAEALDAYNDARRMLADDLGVEPGPELRSLQEAILHQDPALDPDRPVAPLPPELASAALSPVIGRTAELAWLLERWEEAVTQRGAVVAVVGARGIGKTRLAAELAEEVHSRGAAVLYASGDWPAASVARVLDHARAATRPTLVMLDDADRADAGVAEATAELARVIDVLPLLLLAIGEEDGLGAAAELDVEPLGAAAVRAIASLYLPDHEDADAIRVDWLLEASAGIPRRVHEVAAQTARREATRRVGAVAGRAAAGRVELRSMEEELAGSVVQLQTVREYAEPADGDGQPVVCPFKGLASFDVADAPYFFGRERLVAELVARLVGAPLLGVVGPSGSGKSSVVRAGLLPALANGVVPGSEHWQQVLMRPGARPADELRRLTSGLDGDRRTVIAVDQFEETFTSCRDERERTRFIGQLAHLGGRAGGDVVVLAIRADYYGRCATYPELSHLLAANHVLVGAMRHVELRRAVVGPAERVGLHVEAELADALVSDVEHEPGALPLLSTALLELWQRRDGRDLRLSDYEATGGVRGAVARLAEAAFARLDPEQQVVARRVLLRLAEVEVEGGVERRRLPLGQLDADEGPAAASVVGRLADARLLTVSDGSVEFSHEALLREWPRLHDWIEANRDDLKVHRSLSSAADEWTRMGRDDDALLRGARLAEASEWAERGEPGPSDAEREFLAASRERDRRERSTRRRRVALAFAALVVGVVAVTAIALVAIDNGRDASEQRDIALSRQLALESENALAADPERALNLALWSMDEAPTDQAAKALREATLAFRQLGLVRADSLDTHAAAYSPDGRRLLTGGTDGRAIVWDAATGREAARLDGGHGAILAARYAPPGDRIALGFGDGTVALTDASLAGPRTIASVDGAPVESLAFTRDGAQLALGLGDGTVRVIDVGGAAPERILPGHSGAVLGVAISSDGSRVASAGRDGTVRLWQLDADGAAQVLHGPGRPERDVELSPDGTRVLAVGDDRQVRIWDGATGAEQRHFNGEGRQLIAAAFSADGSRFATGGRDGVTRVWSVNGGPPVAVLRGQPARVEDLGFGPRSDRVVSAGDDGSARTWDAGGTQTFTVPSLTFGLDFDRTGQRVATGSEDGTVRVWDPATGRLQASLPGPEGFTMALFSPSADTLLVAASARIRIWSLDAERADVAVRLTGGDRVGWADFDGTGGRIAYVTVAGKVALRELTTGRETVLGGAEPKPVWAAAENPDGRHVLVLPDRDVLLYRTDRPGTPERVLEGHDGPVHAYDFSADGRLVTAGADRIARVWDPDGRQIAVLRGSGDELTSAVFTRGGTRVLTSSQDGTLRLFDAGDGTELAVLQQSQGELYGIALSSDGKIATLGSGDVVRVFACEVCGSLDEVRALARSRSPQPLTTAEREQLLSGAR